LNDLIVFQPSEFAILHGACQGWRSLNERPIYMLCRP